MDESSKQMLEDLHEPAPTGPGRPPRQDYPYRREGVESIFMFTDPHRAWRRVSCRSSRTRRDWAEEVRRLLDEDHPRALKVKLVCDNLDTHSIASLYLASSAEEAQRLASRLEIIHTPRNGSWSNVAEIELSVLAAKQCLARRIGSPERLAAVCAAWERSRNAQVGGSFGSSRLTTPGSSCGISTLGPLSSRRSTTGWDRPTRPLRPSRPVAFAAIVVRLRVSRGGRHTPRPSGPDWPRPCRPACGTDRP